MPEFRNSPDSLRMVDAKRGQVEVDVVPYHVLDEYNTRFAPGVFSASLEKRKPPMCWGHDWKDPIGHMVDHDDDGKRLHALYQLDNFEDVPRARQAYSQIKSGTLNDTSFGFSRSKDQPFEDVEGAFDIVEARLDEVSPVLIGAVPGAHVTGVRQIPAAEVLRLMHEVESGNMTLEDGLVAISRAAESDEMRATHTHAKQDGSGSIKHSHQNDAMAGPHAHSGLMPVTIKVNRAAPVADPDEADTVKCPKCGAMNEADASYCDQCGAKMTPARSAEQSEADDITLSDARSILREATRR